MPSPSAWPILKPTRRLFRSAMIFPSNSQLFTTTSIGQNVLSTCSSAANSSRGRVARGLVLSQYVRANVLLAHRLQRGEPAAAISDCSPGSTPPENTKPKHLLMNLCMIDYWFGVAHHDSGNHGEAERHWSRAARQKATFSRCRCKLFPKTLGRALALERLGCEHICLHVFLATLDYSAHLQGGPRRSTTSPLPCCDFSSMSSARRCTITARFLEAQARLGLGEKAKDSACSKKSSPWTMPTLAQSSAPVPEEIETHTPPLPVSPQSSLATRSAASTLHCPGVAAGRVGYDGVVIGMAVVFDQS